MLWVPSRQLLVEAGEVGAGSKGRATVCLHCPPTPLASAVVASTAAPVIVSQLQSEVGLWMVASTARLHLSSRVSTPRDKGLRGRGRVAPIIVGVLVASMFVGPDVARCRPDTNGA